MLAWSVSIGSFPFRFPIVLVRIALWAWSLDTCDHLVATRRSPWFF
jgi:hypothetical protein